MEEPMPTASPQTSLAKFRDKRVVFVSLTIVLFLIVGVYLLSRTKAPRLTRTGEGVLFEKAGEGSLVGVFHQNGTAYFGKLMFEDENTVLLRDVYQPAGFSPDEQGNLVFQVFRRNEGTPTVDRDYQISKDEILFISEKISPKVAEAIKNYQPQTPAPVSTPAPTPAPSPESSTPSPGSGFRVR